MTKKAVIAFVLSCILTLTIAALVCDAVQPAAAPPSRLCGVEYAPGGWNMTRKTNPRRRPATMADVERAK